MYELYILIFRLYYNLHDAAVQAAGAGDGVEDAAGGPHLEQYSIVQYSTVQYSIVQYSIVQYSIVQYSTV